MSWESLPSWNEVGAWVVSLLWTLILGAWKLVLLAFGVLESFGWPAITWVIILAVPLGLWFVTALVRGTLLAFWSTVKWSIWLSAVVYPFALTFVMYWFFVMNKGWSPPAGYEGLITEFIIHILMLHIVTQLALVGFGRSESTDTMWFDFIRALAPMAMVGYAILEGKNWGLSQYQWSIVRIAFMPVFIDGIIMAKIILRLSRRIWSDAATPSASASA